MISFYFSKNLQAIIDQWDQDGTLIKAIHNTSPKEGELTVIPITKEMSEPWEGDALVFEFDDDGPDLFGNSAVFVYFKSDDPNIDLCPYAQDVNNTEKYCKCTPFQRGQCADDI